jgi:hypothetical protein
MHEQGQTIYETSNASFRDPAKVERYLRLIEECRGNVSAIAREEGVARTIAKGYIDKTPELVSALHDWRQSIVDTAEDNIFKAAEKGDLASSKMIVATLGKDRGWVPREEKTGADGTPLVPPQIVFTTYEDEHSADEEKAAE